MAGKSGRSINNVPESPIKHMIFSWEGILVILLILRAAVAFYQVKRENKALRAEQEALRQREHERLARRAAHRAAKGEEPDEEENEA